MPLRERCTFSSVTDWRVVMSEVSFERGSVVLWRVVLECVRLGSRGVESRRICSLLIQPFVSPELRLRMSSELSCAVASTFA